MRRLVVSGGSIRAAALVCVLGVAVAGCSSAPSQNADPGDTLGNLFAFNSTRAPATPPAQPTNTSVICPIVDVRDGGAAHRVYSGRGTSNADVRHQFSVGETARECTVQDNQLLIRVGVEGKVLLGPAGSSSTFNVPVFIGIRRDEGQAMLVSKVYQVTVAIPSGGNHTTFSVVSEPLAVPFTRENAAADYTVYVGFEGHRETRTAQATRRGR